VDTFAVVENGIVANIIVGVEPEVVAANPGLYVPYSDAKPARIGYTYDSIRDAFIAPQPFPSWTLNNVTTEWEAPTPMPTDGLGYTWDESTLSWKASLGLTDAEVAALTEGA
jgi:hypothetical protein